MSNLNIFIGDMFLTYTTTKHAQILILNTKQLTYNVNMFKCHKCIVIRNNTCLIKDIYDDTLLTQYKRIGIT